MYITVRDTLFLTYLSITVWDTLFLTYLSITVQYTLFLTYLSIKGGAEFLSQAQASRISKRATQTFFRYISVT